MILFLINGQAYEFIPLNIESDNGDGYIWERCDESISGDDAKLIRALADGKEEKMKLLGRQYFKIKQITRAQIAGIRHSLNLYEAMGGVLQ